MTDGYLRWMAEGRRQSYEAWSKVRDSFLTSMFQLSFIALGEQLGLEGANIKIRAFAKELIASFDQDMDAIVAGSHRATPLNDRDKRRVRDWLVLLEESERVLNSVLVMAVGPQQKRLFQGSLKL